MIVRIVTFEGLQPMVTEATTLMRGTDPCTLEVENSMENYDFHDHYLRFCSNDFSDVGVLEICDKD